MKNNPWKKNKILSFTEKWMDMETIILSEISQTQKRQILHGFPNT